MAKKFEIKDYTDEKSIRKGFHKQRRCQVSGGHIYGNVIIMRQGKGRGSGLAVNKESLLNAIENSPIHFKKSLMETLLNDADVAGIMSKGKTPKKEKYEAPKAEVVILPNVGKPAEVVVEDDIPFAEPVKPIEEAIKELSDKYKHAEMLKTVDDAELKYGTVRPTKKVLAKLIIENNLESKVGL